MVGVYMDGRIRRNLRAVSIILSCMLVISLCLPLFAITAQAKSARSAQIIDLTGTVTIKKAGGSKEYEGFLEMFLNEGDHITTGDDSSVVLKVVDRDDEVTIGPNTEMFVSTLTDEGGSKSKFKVWTGSLWFKVKSLVSSEDEFEMETPTAVMGVRGSNGYIETFNNTLNALMTSGVLQATPKSNDNNGTGNAFNIYPGQQASQFPNTGGGGIYVAPIDVQQFVNNAPPEVVAKAIEAIAAARAENAQFVQQLAEGNKAIDPNSTLKLEGVDVLQKFNDNLDNLMANIAKAAVDSKKLPETQVQSLLDKINAQQPEKPIDLKNVKPFDPQLGLDVAKQQQIDEQLKKAKEEFDRQQEAQQREINNAANQLAEILKKWEEQRAQQEIANKKAQDELQKKAQENLPQQEREGFEQKPSTNPQTNPGTTPSSNPTSNTGGNNNDRPNNPVVISPSAPMFTGKAAVEIKISSALNTQIELYKDAALIATIPSLDAVTVIPVTLTEGANRFAVRAVKGSRGSDLVNVPVITLDPVSVELPATVQVGQTFNVSIFVQNMNELYGVEVHGYGDTAFVRTGDPSSSLFVAGQSITLLKTDISADSKMQEITYAAIRDASNPAYGSNISAVNRTQLVSFPLKALNVPQNGTIKVYVKIVNNAGDVKFEREYPITLQVVPSVN